MTLDSSTSGPAPPSFFPFSCASPSRVEGIVVALDDDDDDDDDNADDGR